MVKLFFSFLRDLFCCFPSDFHRCSKALSAKGQDVAPCEWYKRVYKSLCPIGWVSCVAIALIVHFLWTFFVYILRVDSAEFPRFIWFDRLVDLYSIA